MSGPRNDAAIVALSATGGKLARRIQQILGAGEVLGLASRVADADRTFAVATEVIAQCFRAGRPVIGICASGILIRALGAELGDKRSDPPVLAIAEDGSVVVPLLGGHHQGNRWAATLAAALGATAAITTASDVSLGVALDEPPAGWRLRVGDYKSVAARLLAGEPARVTVESGPAPAWLDALPRSETAPIHILVSTRADAQADLVYAPQIVALGVGCERLAAAAELAQLVDGALAEANVAREAVACIASIALKAAEPAIHAVAHDLGVPARFFDAARLEAETPRLK
ncbi:MAG TPA: cobalamin biosynthesis protein, partial [Alphaproteobacteria bacterium]|nr:cobalamin biosynthesis protein [Alphaproteobacteria bacterium]